MKEHFDTLIIGPVSLDVNIDYQNNVRREVGGAVVQSGFAAAGTGHNTAVFTKLNKKDADAEKTFEESGVTLFIADSKETCSIQNKYHTADKEQRDCTSMGKCDMFTADELPAVETDIYHFAGLVYGDFDENMFKELAGKGKIAVDVQCLLRHVEPDKTMAFYDWKNKKKYMPYIDFLKTDAKEAEILTGLTDRAEAAKLLYSWGAKEIMITHNSEVLIYDGQRIYTCPIKARNLSGRTGRGDTTFSGYITERLSSDIENSLQFATALVSLKMETPGPFKGTREDVLEYIKQFY